MIQNTIKKCLLSLAAMAFGAALTEAKALTPQLLTDSGFDSGSQPLLAWGSPDLDRWVAEVAALVTAPENGVSPHAGNGMLRMNWGAGTVTQVLQLVDVSTYAIQIDTGTLSTSGSAMMTATVPNVSGAGLRITAYDTNQQSLGFVSSGFLSNSDPSDWQAVGTFMNVPPQTRFLKAQFLFANNSFSPADQVYVDSVHLSVSSCFIERCFGDGGDQMGCTDCPCGNNVPIGTPTGCMNSTGVGARLIASGSSDIAVPSPGDLRFDMTGAVPDGFAVLISGDFAAPNNSMNPCFGTGAGVVSAFYDGLRCCIGGLQRHGGRPIDSNGEVGMGNNGWGGASAPHPSIAAQGGFLPGQTRCFQALYRELPGMVCMREINTTQAIDVTFKL